MREILVIVPVYNEGKNIIDVSRELTEDVPYMDVLFINDSSRDNTEEFLKQQNANYINTPFNLGYAGVIQVGFKYALLKGYEYVAQFDGDGQHIAKELDKLYKMMKQINADIVIGSRFKEKTGYNHAILRRIGTAIFRKIIRWSSGMDITDPTSGLQVLNKRVYSKYAQMNNYPDYPDANLLAEMILEGYNIEEVGVKMRERVYGESMHKGLWNSFKYMIKMFYSFFFVFIKHTGSRSNIVKEDSSNVS